MTYSEMKRNQKALEREQTVDKYEKPMTYSEMKPISNIRNGKDTLFDDIAAFRKNAVGENAFNKYYSHGFKTADDYTAASDYLNSSVASLKDYRERLEKNRSAYERVYGTDAVKQMEDYISKASAIYSDQGLWDELSRRRDSFAEYDSAESYDAATDMTNGEGQKLDSLIAAAQEKYDNASSNRSYSFLDWINKINGGHVPEDVETNYAKSELERLKQLKLDWENNRADYDDDGNPFALKYDGADYKTLSLAEHKLAVREYELSDSEKRELAWLKNNKKHYATTEELENELALKEGQAKNAQAEAERIRYNEVAKVPTSNEDVNFQSTAIINGDSPSANSAIKYTAEASTLKNYYNERKADEQLEKLQQEIYDKYMPLLDDPEFLKHSEVEKDKESDVYFGADNTTDVYNNPANMYNVKMTDKERSVFYGLYNTDKNRAAEFLDELTPVLNKRMTDTVTQVVQEDTQDNPYMHSALAVLSNLASGISSVEDTWNGMTGKGIDTNSPSHLLSRYTSTVRGTTSQMLDDYLKKNPDSVWNTKFALAGRDENGNYRSLGLFAKETAESIMDNLARMAVTKGIGAAAGGGEGISKAALETIDFTLMGSQVASQTIIDAKEKGLSDGKALAMGFTSGAIEAITEIWSVEKVLKDPKSFIGTLGKSLIAEGSEEISSNILNRAVDVLVNADQSEVMQEYYGYINEGLSPSEASAKTITGILGDDLSAGLGGALSGLVMTGGNYNMAKAVEINESAKRGIKQIQVGNKLKTSDSVITALDEIIKANPENTQAIEAKAAIEKGEKVSARKLGKLLSDEVSNQFEKAYTVDRNEIKTKLEAKGVENANSLSETIAKAFNEGIDSVKGKERTALTHNADAMAVYNEYRQAQTSAAENADRLTLAYSTAGREQLLNYAKEQGRNSGFLQEAADLAEGKTDLDSAIDLQTAVETEIADRFLSADTVEEAQEVFKELSKGAGKDITAILKDSLDTRTDDILAESKYDKVTNVSFKNTRDGVAAYVTTKNGENLSPFAANIGSESAAVINRATAKPAEARTLYATEYLNGNNYLAASSYDRAFTKYYEAGKKGTSFADIKRSTRDIKGDSARRIYEAGRKAAAAETKRQSQYRQTEEYKIRSEARTEANTKAEKTGGVVRDYSADRKVNKNQRGQLRLLDEWAKQKGVVIRVVGSLAEKLKLEDQIINGQYAGGNVIVIALDGKNMLTSTAGHELFHMIKNLAAEYAEDFTAFVIDHLKEAGQYESVFNDYARRYGRTYANNESFKAKIDEEIVAEHCFEALTNKEQWDSFAAENKTLAEKIKDFILEFVAMINRAYDKYFAHDNAEIRNEVLGEIDYMNEIAKRLWEGVDEAVKNYRFGADTESETKFSINEIVDDDGNKYGIGVVLDSNLLEGLNQNERKQMVKERVVGELAGQQVIAYDKSGNAVEINFAQKGDKFKNKNGKNASVLKELYHKNIDKSIKQEAVVLADELVESAKYRESEKAKYSHDWLDNNGKNNWDYWDVYIQDKNKTVYVATLNVANTQNGSKILYDIDPIKKARGPMKSGPTIANINISQNDTDVNTHSMQNSKNNSSFSISDEEYMSAAESGDTRLAQRMVNEAAGEAGYNSPQLYHGTQNFGFTEFDPNKMGDGRSIFLTSSREIASTYSGVGGKRNIETPKSSANMTIDEVANALNEVAKRDNGDLDLSSYRVMNQKDLITLERSVDKGIEDLYDTVQKKIDLYGEKLARDFNDKDEKTLNRLVDLSDLLEHYSYDKLSTPLYMLLHHSDAFTTEKFELSDLEADVRLMQLLKKNDLSNGVVVAEDKDRYYIRALDREKAAKLLDEQNAQGNYALFAKLGNYLEIDGKGKNWNKIFAVLEPQEKTTFSAKYNTDTNTLVLSDEKGTFAEIKRDTLDEATPAMARAITYRYGKFLAATVLSQAKDQLKNSATAEVQVRAVGDRNTREIAEFADEQGYDSVVFRDLMDNGGQNSKVGSSTTADIYIIFDPNNVKSADPITYDNDGNIIPLSERFNENERDIRYQISEKFYEDFDKWDGKDTNTTFEIGNTSKALQSIGIKDQLFIMRSGMVSQKLNKHSELTRSTFRNIPELLEHPVIVQFSDAIDPKTGKPKYDSRVTLLGELYAEMTVDGKKQKTPVLVSVELLPKSKGKTEISDFSVITSAYGHSRLQHYLNENSILYIDPNKKRTNKWLSLNRLQLPLGENRLGSVRRITYIGGKVKIENSKNFSTMQAALEKAGIVNSSGISLLNNSENDTKFSENILSDEVKASISDAGMRLTDDAELSSLMQNNADYKAEIERLKGEFVKSKRMGGKGANRLVQTDINRVARNIIGEYSSGISFYDLKDELTGLYGFIANSEKNSWDYAYAVQAANNIAKSVIAQSFVDITPETFESYKKELRSHRLIPNLDDVAEMTAMFGTFGAAYRQYGKKLNMRAQGTENAVHIDEIWDDLCAAVPLLDKDAQNTQDMWRNLIEVRDSLDEKSGFNPYLSNDELSAEQSAAVLGADILERFYEISPDTTFADRAQQQVNIREKKISELKADKQEALKKLREQRDTKISELKESFRQQNQKRRERSSRTALRHKIKALTADMNRRLLYPKKNEYIPRELMSSVAGVLNAINLDSGKSAALSQKFSVLKSAYEAIQKSEKYQSAYDPVIADMIQNLVEKSSGKFTAVSKENLEYIYDTLKAVDKLCKDAIKVKIAGEEHNAKEFSKQLIKETRQAKTMGRLAQKYTFAQSRPEAVFERFGGFAKNSAWQKMYTLLNDGQLKKTSILIEGKRMFNELVEGKNKKNVDNLISINEKDLVDIGLVDSDGNSVKITRDMMNAVYMMLENEDNTRHLIYGGLTVPDLKGYYKGKNEAFGKGAVRAEIMQGKFVDEIHRIRERIETVKDSNAADKAEQLDELYEKRDLLVAQAYSKAAEIKNKIAEQMTDYDRAWIAKAKEFFDGFSRDQMNAVTLMVYGFEKARIENYFPIHTDSAFRNEDFGVIQKAANLENMGFTKERVFSGSPIMLEGLTDVINGHIDDIANYAGLMPSVREFQKVYGKNMTDENGLTSVQNALREKFGTQGRKYISDLLGDITGSRQRSGSAFFNRIRGNMAQATLSVNARVALSQAASYPTAAAEIGWKPLTKALGMGLKKADKALIAEYSPLLAYRMAGYSNPEIGNIKDLGKTQNKVLKNTAWLMNWITQIDGATVGRLWYASQFYVDDNNSQLKAAFDKATAEHKANSISDEQFQKAKDDYYNEVAKVFNRVVERTQPNYTTMQRPAVLRSDKDLIRSMTMFYTQRLQNVSILYDAFSRMRSYSESYKNNPSGDVTAEDVKTARNEFGRAVFSQIVATTTLTAMKTIVDILLQSLYAYRDPDDDITPESFWGNVGYNFLDSFVSNLLFGSEMLKIAKAAYQIYDGSFSSRNADDFITIGGVETINDFTVYLEKFGDSFSKYVNGEGDLEDLGKSGLNLAKITGTLTGVPVANIGKLVEGIVSLGDKIAEGKSLLSSGENKKTGTSSKKNMDKYNAAYAKADSSAAKEAVRTMIEEEKQKLLENGADQYAANSKGQNKVTLEAKQNVRNKFSNEYRDKYKQAYRNKDTKTVAEIKTKLSLTGLYDNLDDTLEKWRDSADEDANQEKRAKEYAERQK
jgi:hypothetical protein